MPKITITADSREDLVEWLASVLAAPGRVQPSKAVRDQLYDRQKGRCADCGERLILIGPAPCHADHIVPLARGGTNDVRNFQLLCAPCNLTKGARDPVEHARTLGRLRQLSL